MAKGLGVIAAGSPLLWYLTRSAAAVSLVLLTLSTVLGIATTTRVGIKAWPRFASAELHRRVSILAMVFVVLHICSTVFDSYVSVPLLAAVVPLASSYKSWAVSFGAIAFDLMVLVMFSSVVRQKISANAWRAVHYLVYLSLPIAFVHVVTIGTDFKHGQAWMVALTAVCAGVLVCAVVVRVWLMKRVRSFRTMPPKESGCDNGPNGGHSTAHPRERPRPAREFRSPPRSLWTVAVAGQA